MTELLKTAHYEVVRAGRAYLVRELATGELIQTRKKADAEAWIRKAERNAEKDAYWAARERETRVERVREYLAHRAIREAAAPKQLEFVF